MTFFRYCLAIFLSALLCAQSALAADEQDEGLYPVWWEPVIEYAAEHGYAFEKLEDAERLLTTPLQHGKWVARKNESEEDGYEIFDCATYKHLAEQNDHITYMGAQRWTVNESYRQGSWGVFCQALEQLSKAIPAKKSFVRDFVLDKNALNYLPAFLDVPMSSAFRCISFDANKQRVPLNLFWQRTSSNSFEAIKAAGDRIELTYEELGNTLGTTIKLLARGDFDHDSLEDMLMLSEVSLRNWGFSEYFVVTRDAPDAVLYLLDAERHTRHLYEGQGCEDNEPS